ncbi:MAG: hypothetical protein QXI89_02185 [Candidatus Anstonellales archaeon]
MQILYRNEKKGKIKYAWEKFKDVLKKPNTIKTISLSLYAASLSALTGYFIGLHVSNERLSKQTDHLDYSFTLIQQNYEKQKAVLVALLLLLTYAGLGFPGLSKRKEHFISKDMEDN